MAVPNLNPQSVADVLSNWTTASFPGEPAQSILFPNNPFLSDLTNGSTITVASGNRAAFTVPRGMGGQDIAALMTQMFNQMILPRLNAALGTGSRTFTITYSTDLIGNTTVVVSW